MSDRDECSRWNAGEPSGRSEELAELMAAAERRPPVLEALCNQCGERSTHHTRTDAFIALTVHEWITGHNDQLWSSMVGWTRFRAAQWVGCWVTDGGMKL